MNEPVTPAVADSRIAIHRSIAGRLLTWFLLISLVPCIALAVITANIATQALEGSVREKHDFIFCNFPFCIWLCLINYHAHVTWITDRTNVSGF
jgi:hypothetical protein